MIPSEVANINSNASENYTMTNNDSLLSVVTNEDADHYHLLESHMNPSAPSPPLAMMEEEDFHIHHNSHPELDPSKPETPETDLMPGDGDFELESRAFPDEPDTALIPYGPGSGIIIRDDNNREVFIPDQVNTYQQKKNLAQGMMDLALLSANANQLRYVLETFDRHPYNYVSLVLILISLIIQVAVGIGLILNSQYNVTKSDHMDKADKINNYTIIGIFLITVVNVFITSFGVADSNVVS